jgi:O-antigen biosynthesis protein
MSSETTDANPAPPELSASVIVLAWNGSSDLPECLDALLQQDSPAPEIIVVDNASTDDSAGLVARRYPQVRLIRNARNEGFAGGNNVGLRAARGDVLVLLNQDTVVRPDWLRNLLAALASDPGVGIAGCKTLYPDGLIQHAGGCVDERGEARHYGYRQPDRGEFDTPRDVDFVTGAALAIRRQTLDAIGELDPGFAPAYYEDIDLCYRARRSGFRVRYVPGAVLVHRERSSAARADHAGLFLLQRNRLRFVFKHWPLRKLRDEFAPIELAWLAGLGEGAEQLVASVHHAYFHQVLNLGDLVFQRSRLAVASGDASGDEAADLAELLMRLRTTIPLKPARLTSHAQ